MMSNNQTTEKRRKLLQSFIAGSGAIITGASLPDRWVQPIVESVILPAHAETSSTIHCGSHSEPQAAGQDSGDIAILFNGNECSFKSFNQDADGVPSDALIAFDSDLDDNLLWDDLGTGSHWTRNGSNVPGTNDNPNGSYYVDVANGGASYRVTFSVQVSSADSGPPYASGTMSVSNVTITPI